MMKLLTLNTHSLQERDYPQKLEQFVETVLTEQPDLIAMQEASQSMEAPPLSVPPAGYVPAPGHEVPLRRDNHAAQTAHRLRAAGAPYSWTWLPVKRGYRHFDEGLALFSLGRAITEVDAFRVSEVSDYDNWRTRKALGVRLAGVPGWFYSVHLSWWNDGQEPFQRQWAALEQALSPKKAQGPVWLLGDFNAPAEVRGESYDRIAAAGWRDAWLLAAERKGGVTVRGSLDGWRDKAEAKDGLRIDQIWCSQTLPITRGRILFDGADSPIVSDHYGVLVEADPLR